MNVDSQNWPILTIQDIYQWRLQRIYKDGEPPALFIVSEESWRALYKEAQLSVPEDDFKLFNILITTEEREMHYRMKSFK